jgi:hypothetical protein
MAPFYTAKLKTLHLAKNKINVGVLKYTLTWQKILKSFGQ